jgi:(p)ppGpp synthase/HD superfamily hydrolase
VLRRSDTHAFGAALLHDVVETGRISLDDLRARTGDDRVVALVDLLTRRPDESERDYLARCASDPDALLVKRADLADKVLCDDFTVAATVAESFQRQAIERLALLDTVSRIPPRVG